jgi:hypothetical protein
MNWQSRRHVHLSAQRRRDNVFRGRDSNAGWRNDLSNRHQRLISQLKSEEVVGQNESG